MQARLGQAQAAGTCQGLAFGVACAMCAEVLPNPMCSDNRLVAPERAGRAACIASCPGAGPRSHPCQKTSPEPLAQAPFLRPEQRPEQGPGLDTGQVSCQGARCPRAGQQGLAEGQACPAEPA